MFRWVPFPFVRYCLVLIAGIIVSGKFPMDLDPMIAPVILLIFSGIELLLSRIHSYYLTILSGITAWGLFFVLGILSYQLHDRSADKDHILHRSDPCEAYQAKVLSIDKQDSQKIKMVVEVENLRGRNGWEQASGRIMLTIREPDKTNPTGSTIMIAGCPERTRPPMNPGVFNYRSYLEKRNIYHSHIVDNSQVHQITEPEKISLSSTASNIRAGAIELFRKKFSDPGSLGIAEALVLGYKRDLTTDVREAWAGTGSMHVLAVSGLHVGIIYIFLNLVLGWLKKLAGGKIAFVIISIGILCFYALLTGLSASVLRATLMFSLLIIGEGFRKQTNIYNTISVSAFILLMADPFLLQTIGFQLSYLAVLGIVTLHRGIYSLIYSRFWLIDKVWSLTSVSVSAQLATFPLMIYYFHQLPLYGLITNLLVIPSAFIILVMVSCGSLLQGLLDMDLYIFSLTEHYISLLNSLISRVYELPFSTFQINSWRVSRVLLIYAIISCLVMVINLRKARILSLLCILIFINSFILFNQNEEYGDFLVLYHHYRGIQIDLLGRERSVTFHSPGLKKTLVENRSKAASVNFRTLEPQQQNTLSDSVDFINVNGKILAVIQRLPRLDHDSVKLRVDYLFLGRSATYDLEEILDHFEFEQLIVGSGMGKKRSEVVRGLLKKNAGKSRFHFADTEGAYIEKY